MSICVAFVRNGFKINIAVHSIIPITMKCHSCSTITNEQLFFITSHSDNDDDKMKLNTKYEIQFNSSIDCEIERNVFDQRIVPKNQFEPLIRCQLLNVHSFKEHFAKLACVWEIAKEREREIVNLRHIRLRETKAKTIEWNKIKVSEIKSERSQQPIWLKTATTQKRTFGRWWRIRKPLVELCTNGRLVEGKLRIQIDVNGWNEKRQHKD